MEKAVKKTNVKLTVRRVFYDKTDGLKRKKKGEELTVSSAARHRGYCILMCNSPVVID